MSIVEIIKHIVNPLRIDIVKYPNSDFRRRKKLLNHFYINKVLDVGANTGQYAQLLRKHGFKGKIISFEPITKAYKNLMLNAQKDINWDAYNFALGNKEEERMIYISKNVFSSSLLSSTPELLTVAPHSNYVDKEKILVKKLENIYNDLVVASDIVFLKIDVQGFE